jgi:hypothetical protein
MHLHLQWRYVDHFMSLLLNMLATVSTGGSKKVSRHVSGIGPQWPSSLPGKACQGPLDLIHNPPRRHAPPALPTFVLCLLRAASPSAVANAETRR